MEKLVKAVMDTMAKSGFVEVEVSARHVHLTEADLKTLFGEDAVLHEKRLLSQKGQYLSWEKVTLVGPKKQKERVSVLGPVRKYTQVELSESDCVELGINAPVRESGDLADAAPITIVGPCGTITLEHAAIVAHNHIHVPPEMAETLGLSGGERLSVQVFTDRPLTFDDVVIRVDESFRFRMHIDFDEANAARVKGFTLGRIIRNDLQ